MESFDKGARLKEQSITLNLDAKEYYWISLVDYHEDGNQQSKPT